MLINAKEANKRSSFMSEDFIYSKVYQSIKDEINNSINKGLFKAEVVYDEDEDYYAEQVLSYLRALGYSCCIVYNIEKYISVCWYSEEY